MRLFVACNVLYEYVSGVGGFLTSGMAIGQASVFMLFCFHFVSIVCRKKYASFAASVLMHPLCLSASLSRYKLKFNPDKVDTMVVQAICECF